MVRFMRSALAVIGRFPEAMAFAKEIAEYVRGTHGVDLKVYIESDGTIYWITDYPDYETFASKRAAITADAGYWEIITKAEGLLLDGSVQDTVLTAV
jgi:hypothetical protein